MAMNKKGYFFTIIAFLIVGLALIKSIGPYRNPVPPQEAQHVRIITLDNFVTDVQKDIQRALSIATFRSLLALDQQVIGTGNYLTGTQSAFATAIVNASYNNTPLALVGNTSLNDWHSRVDAYSRETGVALAVTFNNITIRHVTPWDVQSSVLVDINVTDLAGTARFDTRQNITVQLSIIGFEDPLYPANTYGRVANVINQTNNTNFVQGNNTAVLQNHLNKGLYINHSDAPSFLMRLEGNFSASPYGIESLVNLDRLTTQDVPLLEKSAVDYLYFGNTSAPGVAIQTMPAWFRLDSAHLSTYQVSGLTG